MLFYVLSLVFDTQDFWYLVANGSSEDLGSVPVLLTSQLTSLISKN